MSRPRTPAEILEARGSYIKHPERRRPPCPKSTMSIGHAPSYFTSDEKQIWKEVVKNSIPDILTSSDRIMLELFCMIMAKIRNRDIVKSSELSILVNISSQMGMSPISRTKLSIPDNKHGIDSNNPYAKFSIYNNPNHN